MPETTHAVSTVNGEPDRLDWALRMAEAGFHVFPIQAGGKKPLSEGWQDQATTDPAVIRQWFANATGMNYGLALKDGQAVVDLDRKPGGADGLEAFEGLAVDHDDWKWAEPDNCPAFTVETPSGGRHLYVNAGFPVSNSVNKWAPGIDVRGTGGYVLGPGCYTDGRPGTAKGSYTTRSEAVELPAAPGWVRDRFRRVGAPRESSNVTPLFELDTPANVVEARRFLENRAPAIEGQGGDAHTYTTFTHLHQIGISAAKALELVCEEGGWNWRCDPPWERGELELKAANAYRYAKEPPGSRPSAYEVFTEATESTAEGGQAANGNDMPDDGEEDALRADFERIKRKVFSGDSIANVKPVPHLVEGFIPATHQTTAVCAVRGLGKTVFLVHLGLSLSNVAPGVETTWMNQAAYGRHVIYFSYEDFANNCQHVRAWCDRNRSGPDDVPERFHLVDGGPDLMNAADVKAWTRFIREYVTRGEPALVIVDTWQRAAARGKQNADDEMQIAVGNLEALARSLNATPVCAFHPPKDGSKTLLGSGVLENNAGAIWYLESSNGGVKAEVGRIKGPGHDNYILYELDDHALPENPETGQPVPAKVAKYLGGTQEDDGGQERTRIKRENARAKAQAVAEAVQYVLGIPETKPSQRGICQALIERYKLGPEKAKAEAHRKRQNVPEVPKITYPWRSPETGDVSDEPGVVNITSSDSGVRNLLTETFPPNIPIQLPDSDLAVVRHVKESNGIEFRVVDPHKWHFGEGA